VVCAAPAGTAPGRIAKTWQRRGDAVRRPRDRGARGGRCEGRRQGERSGGPRSGVRRVADPAPQQLLIAHGTAQGPLRRRAEGGGGLTHRAPSQVSTHPPKVSLTSRSTVPSKSTGSPTTDGGSPAAAGRGALPVGPIEPTSRHSLHLLPRGRRRSRASARAIPAA